MFACTVLLNLVQRILKNKKLSACLKKALIGSHPGLDHFINGSFNKGTFYKFFGELIRRKELDNIDTKSSLHLYKTFNITGRTQKYLININDFRGSRLKLLYIYLLFSINHHNLTRYREIHMYNIYNIQ
jgi:hypothetical protein